MGWFSKKKETIDIVSPAEGDVIPITQVPDEVFAGKMMGDGFAVNPTNGEIVAPVAGKVTFIADTKHGIGLTSDTGMELIIHMGIDTVSLKGKPFNVYVNLNEKVHAGTPLVTIDLEVVKKADLNPVIIVAITNFTDLEKRLDLQTGLTKAGKKVAMLS
ncbi:PTS sugar transporter subunit IIA [Pediococcus cellicola]|uniref:TreB protein n=1 Tax=Pediococcus cellicola TaxID=319652 RepID=A0A0R2ISY0_9LACO|nr:PTS glucose transporter subunit IIA [Pediococcus cellicola]KRN65015.1 treB protein [Pediococcus cellicola]GEL15900.1 PTS glucose transporter subunit IIABC [Pediococcus cellicola]